MLPRIGLVSTVVRMSPFPVEVVLLPEEPLPEEPDDPVEPPTGAGADALPAIALDVPLPVVVLSFVVFEPSASETAVM